MSVLRLLEDNLKDDEMLTHSRRGSRRGLKHHTIASYHTQTHAHTPIHPYIHTKTRTHHMHTHTDTNTHTHTHTHTHRLTLLFV